MVISCTGGTHLKEVLKGKKICENSLYCSDPECKLCCSCKMTYPLSLKGTCLQSRTGKFNIRKLVLQSLMNSLFYVYQLFFVPPPQFCYNNIQYIQRTCTNCCTTSLEMPANIMYLPELWEEAWVPSESLQTDPGTQHSHLAARHRSCLFSFFIFKK